jgi:hypothetical protein
VDSKDGSGNAGAANARLTDFSKDRRFTLRSNLALEPGAPINVATKAAIDAADYVLLNCGASVPGAIRDEMAFTSACGMRLR